MKLTFGGVRGSATVTGEQFLRYGGSTTSFLVTSSSGQPLIVDAGTGIQSISDHVMKSDVRDISVFLTHYHLDHLSGLVNFTPIYDKDWKVEIAALARGGVKVSSTVKSLFGEPFWPLEIDELESGITFTELQVPMMISQVRNDLSISWCPVRHSPSSIAYRIEDIPAKKTVVIATDVEWQASSDDEKQALIDLCRGADVLVMDAHYTPEEYPKFVGWGHSSWQDAIDLAKAANVSKLYLTHHSPRNDDNTLDQFEQDVRAVMPSASLARQGDEVEI